MITRDLRDVRNSGINSTPTVFIQIGGQKPYALQNPLDLALMRAALADALKG